MIKLYKRINLQDKGDFSIDTLDEMKWWLSEFWIMNFSDELDEMEMEQLVGEINKSDEDELLEKLLNVEYCYDELDENEFNFYRNQRLTNN